MILIDLMLLLFITTALLFLSGCDQVKITDEIWYGNKGMVGAVEFHTLTTGQKNLSFEDWMKLLKDQPMVCTSVNTFGDVKAAFEKLCSVCNCCSYDTTKAAETFFSNIKKATSN